MATLRFELPDGGTVEVDGQVVQAGEVCELVLRNLVVRDAFGAPVLGLGAALH